MNSADKWCLGFQRNPHVPAAALVVINGGARLCAICWSLWIRTDTPEDRP